MNTQSSATDDSIKVLRLQKVCEVTGLCRSSIYQMEANLRFPKRVKMALVLSVGSNAKSVPS